MKLPPYHCEFNAMELAWAMVKGYVKQHNTTFKLNDVRYDNKALVDSKDFAGRWDGKSSTPHIQNCLKRHQWATESRRCPPANNGAERVGMRGLEGLKSFTM